MICQYKELVQQSPRPQQLAPFQQFHGQLLGSWPRHHHSHFAHFPFPKRQTCPGSGPHPLRFDLRERKSNNETIEWPFSLTKVSASFRFIEKRATVKRRLIDYFRLTV